MGAEGSGYQGRVTGDVRKWESAGGMGRGQRGLYVRAATEAPGVARLLADVPLRPSAEGRGLSAPPAPPVSLPPFLRLHTTLTLHRPSSPLDAPCLVQRFNFFI